MTRTLSIVERVSGAVVLAEATLAPSPAWPFDSIGTGAGTEDAMTRKRNLEAAMGSVRLRPKAMNV